MLFSLFASSAFASIKVAEMQEPFEFDIDLNALNDPAKPIITYDQLNGALKKADCDGFVNAKKMKIKKSDRCWHYNRPHNCPKLFVKYHDMPLIHAKVGAAAVAVDPDGKGVGLVVGNVTAHIKPSKYTVQPEGIMTFPCDGLISGIISGAAATVKGVLDLSAEGVPVIGELAAEPLDGLVTDLTHTLTGVCGFLEKLLGGILAMLGQVLDDVLGHLLPEIVTDLLKSLVDVALDVVPGTTKLASELGLEPPLALLE